jgi:hypothetical protein
MRIPNQKNVKNVTLNVLNVPEKAPKNAQVVPKIIFYNKIHAK